MKNLKSGIIVKLAIVALMMIGISSCKSRKPQCDSYNDNSDFEKFKIEAAKNIQQNLLVSKKIYKRNLYL